MRLKAKHFILSFPVALGLTLQRLRSTELQPGNKGTYGAGTVLDNHIPLSLPQLLDTT